MQIKRVKKVLEAHNSGWYSSRYLTTNSWKCLPDLWCHWWSTGTKITHICTDVTTSEVKCQWSVCIQLNDHYARKSGNKAILHVITVRKIGCQQMWQRTGRDFLYFHLSPVTAYRSSSKSSRIIANTNRVLWRTLQLERFLTLVVSADLRIWWSCCCFLKQNSNSKRRLSIYCWFVLYSFDIIFILFILK